MSKQWTANDEAILKDGIASGKSQEQLAELLGRTVKSIQSKLYHNRDLISHPSPDFPDMPDVESVSIEEWLEHLQVIQGFRNKIDPVLTSAEIRIKTDGKPIAFSPTSCWHLGGLYTFYEEFKRKFDEVLQIDRFYWASHGDEIEMFPADWASTVFTNLIPPGQQKLLIAKIIDRLHENGKLLYSMWSNHPAFEERRTGDDPMRVIYRNKVPYFAGKGLIKLYVDDQLYVLSVAHVFKGHSQWNPNHSQRKQIMYVPQADFVIQGDKHTYAYQELVTSAEALDAGLQNNTVVHLVQTGTAKSLNDPYSVRWFTRGHFIWPVFVLSAKEHRIIKVNDRANLEFNLARTDY